MLMRLGRYAPSAAPCGLAGASCAQCPQLRGCPTLRGLGVISLPGGLQLPDWLSDWRVWAAAAAGVLLLGGGMFGGKAARRKKRKRVAEARLRYMQERLK